MSYFFVGGSQRCGTSLLQLILCQDSKTNPMLRDASYLRFLVQCYHNVKAEFASDAGDYFGSEKVFREFHAGVVNQFLEFTMERFAPAEHLVLKENHLTQYIPDLFDLVPDARVIVVVRDPRDAIASMIVVGEKIHSQGGNHFFHDRNMQQLCNYYQSFYAASFSSISEEQAGNILIIRYEDLVSEQENVMEILRNFTGLQLHMEYGQKLDTGEIDYEIIEARYLPWVTKKYGRIPESSSVGKYKEVLLPDEIEEIQHHCSQICEKFGYI